MLVLAVHAGLNNTSFGFIGVDMFFVLSGFLITSLLLEEWEQSGTISLKSFYGRRALRLLPALVVMLTVFVSYGFASLPSRKALRLLQEGLGALFYYANWSIAFGLGRPSLFLHTWSLSVEEQFYLLWPIALLFLVKWTDRRSMFQWVLLGAVLSWVTRVVLFFVGTQVISGNVFPIREERLFAGIDTRADSLLLGCAAALALSAKLLSPGNRHVALRVASPICALALAVIGYKSSVFEPWMICIGWFVVSALCAVIILQLAVTQHTLLHRMLENPALVYTGKISYGLYLWHYPIFVLAERWRWAGGYLGALLASVVAAVISYYFIERPFLRLKERLKRTRPIEIQ
jgi:peptidoglycan/LPS O-acetylase OafA/YrhL